MFFIFLSFVCCITLAFPASAEGEFFKIRGHQLFFDTEKAPPGWDGLGEQFNDMLMLNPEVSEIVLAGPGGDFHTALDMLDVIRLYELNTLVEEPCRSACALLFLGGVERRIASGGRLGFHRVSWRKHDSTLFYRRSIKGLGNNDVQPYQEWIFEDGEEQAATLLEEFTQTRVTPEFIIKVLRTPSTEMWYPEFGELLYSGVITGIIK